ncbi:hypothetical protein L9F63_002670, partial [Diploptera punctata]
FQLKLGTMWNIRPSYKIEMNNQLIHKKIPPPQIIVIYTSPIPPSTESKLRPVIHLAKTELTRW